MNHPAGTLQQSNITIKIKIIGSEQNYFVRGDPAKNHKIYGSGGGEIIRGTLARALISFYRVPK